MPLDMRVLDQVVSQEYAVTILKGYALGFVLSFVGEEQEAELRAIVDNSIRFEHGNAV